MKYPENFYSLSPQEQADWKAWAESSVLTRRKPASAPQKFTETAEWAQMVDRMAILQESARNAPHKPAYQPEHTVITPRGFDADILHNRYLLGGETVFDGASLHNPVLRQTEVTCWYEDVFAPSGHRSALIIGAAGAGKTWGSLAYLNSIARPIFDGQRVNASNAAFITAFRLAEMFNNQKRFQEQLDRLKGKKILMVDDLGAEPSGFRGADFCAYFDNLFAERHMYKLITLITSNATIQTISELYGARFVSRFNDAGSFLETRDSDMRSKG